MRTLNVYSFDELPSELQQRYLDRHFAGQSFRSTEEKLKLAREKEYIFFGNKCDAVPMSDGYALIRKF